VNPLPRVDLGASPPKGLRHNDSLIKISKNIRSKQRAGGNAYIFNNVGQRSTRSCVSSHFHNHIVNHFPLAMAPYIYQPLALPHETRVLTILPGRFGDEMRCELSHINFESGERYEALSYCWGGSVAQQLDLNGAADQLNETISMEPTDTVGDLLGDPEHEWLYIKYGGVLPGGIITIDELDLPVGGELCRAMQRLRDDRTSIRIWIDAVCINQNDMQERTEHVKIMGSIYQNASKVRVWLGDEINLETQVCRALRGLNRIFIELAPKLESADIPQITKIILCQSHPQWYQIEWYALAQLFNRAWVTKVPFRAIGAL
jgi:hypothetical protein